jgi:DNA mismatch endonuclease (patch repair protein)
MVPRRADLVFPVEKVAVYVDGCFWHACPEHGTWPKTNAEWWRSKIEANRQRDRDSDRQLEAAGWLPIRIWAHEHPAGSADMVAAAVVARRK